MAWKPEVFVEGKWNQNGLAFATEIEAKHSADNLMWRWLNVQDARAVEVVGLPANYVWTEEGAKPVANSEAPSR
jgi:hypothetical protein